MFCFPSPFSRCRFARGPPDELDIASPWREEGLQKARSGKRNAFPKYICNVATTLDPSIHGTHADHDTVIRVHRDLGIINHYRNRKGSQIEYGQKFAELPDETATVKDEDFLPSVPLLGSTVCFFRAGVASDYRV